MLFKIESYGVVDGIVAVAVRDDLDLLTMPELRAHLDRVLADNPRGVILNFCAVEYLDSSALVCILTVRRKLAESGGRLAIAGARASVLKLLHLTGIDELIGIHETEAEAADALQCT